MHKFVVVAALLITLSLPTYSQSATLKGNIYNKESLESIGFANVYIDSLYSTATASNAYGHYQLNKLKPGHYTLCVSHLGYEIHQQKVELQEGLNTIDIALNPKSETLSPIVVTGTGTHHRIDNVPVQTEIITQKDIAELSGRNVEEIISSISSSIDYTNSSMGTNIKINGLGSDYVLILLNGKRLTGGVGSYVDLTRINSEDIAQIEIVKGASSTLYGSDAIAGVINIITKKPKQNLSITNNTRLGAYGELKQLNSVNYSKGKLSSKTTFNYKQKDGYQINNMRFNNKWESNHDLPYLVPTYYKPVNKSRAYTISQHFAYDINNKLSINTDLSWYEKRLFFPFKAQMHDYYYNDRTAAAGAKYKLKNKNFIELSLSYNNYLYYTEYPYKFNETFITNTEVLNQTIYSGDRFKNSETQTINTQFKGVFNLNKKNRLSVGAELLSEYLEAQYRLTKPDVEAHTYAVYAQNETKLTDKLDLVTGLRAIYHNQAGFSLTPKLTLMYKHSNLIHRLTYSNGFKSPTLKELYYYYESDRMGMYRLYLGNKDLKPQRSHYISYSTEVKIKALRTSINLYINRVNDKIDYAIIPTSYDHRRRGIEETKMRYNIDEAQTIGIDWHAAFTFFKQLQVQTGYSYVDARNLTQNIRLNGVSKHSATAKAAWTKRWKSYHLNLTLAGVYKSDRFYLEEDLERTTAKPYQLWKLTSSHTLKYIKSCNITGIIGVDNILDYVDDSPYGSHYGTLNPGRTIFAGVNLKFSKSNKT
ncbi:TonB-dependent receptor [Carboxylicivirga sp. A043]|uniref:TonB-dependent receptor n=1 Tax=Carboxylicivirga litoralis TaxID=2816963 RepID=UPI0021CB4CD5|nr:TonB-dependent receptor [Carboxylicivirga sp. A043]MCU4155119.1 TonB-dependent receptor [Carboxylicivirga sp. A043]